MSRSTRRSAVVFAIVNVPRAADGTRAGHRAGIGVGRREFVQILRQRGAPVSRTTLRRTEQAIQNVLHASAAFPGMRIRRRAAVRWPARGAITVPRWDAPVRQRRR